MILLDIFSNILLHSEQDRIFFGSESLTSYYFNID